MRTHVSVEVDDILDLVNCADDYGHRNDVIMDALPDMLGRELSDEEIVAYADGFLSPEMCAKGYRG